MRIRSLPAGENHIALVDTQGGAWEPVRLESSMSHGAAVVQCVGAIREQVHELEGLVSRRLDIIDDNLKRLYEGPGKDDEVFVDGNLCTVDKDGFLVIPEPEPAPPVEIEPHIVKALVELATGKRKLSRSDELVVDMALADGACLLAAIAATHPAVLGKVARFIARVYQKRYAQADRSDSDSE